MDRIRKRWLAQHEEDVIDAYEHLCDILEELRIPGHIITIDYNTLRCEVEKWLFATS